MGGRSLVISDGGLTALLAAAAVADRGGAARSQAQSVLWAHCPGAESAAQRTAIQRQAELYGLSEVASDTPGETGRGLEAVSCMMIRAGLAAAAAGAEAVVWPVSAGPDVDLAIASRAVDRAMLASKLVGLDLGAAAPEFRTPYVDFTDAQIADLVLDMDLPVWLCWWWEGGSSAAAAERDRWMTALRAVGWRGDVPVPEVVTRPGADRTRMGRIQE